MSSYVRSMQVRRLLSTLQIPQHHVGTSLLSRSSSRCFMLSCRCIFKACRVSLGCWLLVTTNVGPFSTSLPSRSRSLMLPGFKHLMFLVSTWHPASNCCRRFLSWTFCLLQDLILHQVSSQFLALPCCCYCLRRTCAHLSWSLLALVFLGSLLRLPSSCSSKPTYPSPTPFATISLANAKLVLVILHLYHSTIDTGQPGCRPCFSTSRALMVKLHDCPIRLKLTSSFATTFAVSPGSSSSNIVMLRSLDVCWLLTLPLAKVA